MTSLGSIEGEAVDDDHGLWGEMMIDCVGISSDGYLLRTCRISGIILDA